MFLKISLFFLIIVVSMFTSTVWARDYLTMIELTPAEQAWLAAHPEIRLGIDKNWTPYVKPQSNGDVVGVAPDLFARINALTGANIRLVLGQWADIVKQAERGELDGLAFSSAQPEREAYFLFSSTLFSNSRYMYVLSDKISSFRSMADFAGKKVATQRAALAEQKILAQWPAIIPVLKDSANDLVVALLNGEVDAITGVIAMQQWLQAGQQIKSIDVAFSIPNSEIQIVSSIRKEYPELLSIINKAIAAIGSAGIVEILTQWNAHYEILLSAEERTYLKNLTLQRVIPVDWMPFSFKDTKGVLIGLSEDYWALIRDKLGLHETVTGVQPFLKVFEALQQGKTDLHIGTTRVKERESYLIFSESYDHYPIAIATRKAAGFFSNVAGLENQIVAVGKSYSTYYLLKARYPAIHFLEVKNTAIALEEVAHGHAFAAVDALPALQYQLAQFKGNNVVLAGVSDVEFPLQIAVRKEHARLIPLINQAIALITPQERLRIQQKWMQRSVITETNYTLLWQLTGLAILIIAIILYWNRRLSKEIVLRKSTEQQLQQTTERLRSILDSMDDLVFVIDPGGYYLDCYQHNLANLLLPPSQFLGKHYRDVLPESLATLVEQALSVVQEKGVQHFEYSLFLADGEHWFSANLSARYDSTGQFNGTTAVVRDVTKHYLTEQTLRDNEAQLRILGDNLPNGLIYQIDSGTHGQIRRFIYISAGVEKLHGVKAEAVLNDANLIYSQIVAEDVSRAAELESRAIADMVSLGIELRFQLPNGDIYWRLFTSAPRRLTNGHIIWDGIEIDITDRKRAEAGLILALQRQKTAEHFLRETIDALTAHLCVLDENGKILMVNRAWCQFADMNDANTPDYWVGHNYLGCYKSHEDIDCDSDSMDFFCRLYQVLTGKLDSFQFEYPCHSPTEERWFIAHVTRFSTAPMRVVITHENITARKQAELELVQARHAAEAANQAKSAFIANMSHELRTPLNAVLGFAQILKQDCSLNPQQQNQIHSIQRGGEYLLTLINDILDLAKIEAGRFELFPQAWNSHSFFQEISYMFQVRTEQKGIYFQYKEVAPLPHSLYCDNKRLRQILMNLLGNAVKFTEHGGIILQNSYELGKLKLEIIDTGVGIATHDIEKIFEPFQQTGTDRYKVQGTGLGLAITHRLVLAMEGTLQVNSVLGQGSVFRIEIPAETVSIPVEAGPQTQQAKVTGYRRTQGTGPLRILEVDDLPDNREVVRGLLEPLGFTVAEVTDGQECLDLIPHYQPDLIFMDIRMPGLDGLQTTQQLRAQGVTIPIIVLSASTFADDHTASLEAGCNAHFAKPIHLTELLDILAQLLPLEWQYETLVSTPTETKSAVETLSPEQQKQFIHLARSGDIQGLKEFAKQLEPNYPQFANMLSEMVSHFEIKKIHELAEEYEQVY